MRNRRTRSKAPEPPPTGNDRCEAVYRATLAIATELSLDAVLQKIVDSARELVHARYGALGVVDEERRRLVKFVVSGVTDEQVRAMGHWPRGLGLLGELIRFPRPLRVKNVAEDPRSVGFPPNHPHMTSFLGVPIIRGTSVLGNFYMTNKTGAEEFSESDEEILTLFAAYAAIAIENARLYTETDIRLKEKVVEVERTERRARFLAEVGALLLRLPPGEDLPLELIAERATEPLGDLVAIYLLDPNAPERVTRSAVYHGTPARREAATEALQSSWEGLKEDVVRRKRPILLPELGAGEPGPAFDPEALARGRFSAALAVPIATRQATYGFLVSLASRPITFAEDDLRFASLIADRLGAALDGISLYRKELEARQRVEELANLAQRRASELETVLDTMTEAVYVVDRNADLVRLNRAYAQLVGLPDKESAIGPLRRHVARLKPRSEDGRPLSFEELPPTRALRGETFTNQVIVVAPLGGGRDRYLSVSGAPIHDADGTIIAAVNVARDVTELKDVDRLKDEFISVASHELKTPLTVVKGYGQILLQKLEALPERAAEARLSRQILDQADRMSALADRLLDVSRIQFGRLQLERQQVDLAELVRQVSESMQVGIPDHAIRVRAEQPVEALVDPDRIEQVLSNLISNAAKYSPAGTDIEVTLEQREDHALISVRDHGPGIPREQQPFIFQRFYRARTGEGKRGLGLGLYLSKGIVEAHGGRIWFESEEGKGTTFYVLLPRGARDRGSGAGA